MPAEEPASSRKKRRPTGGDIYWLDPGAGLQHASTGFRHGDV